MTVKEFEILVEFHKDGNRQGPGSDQITELALKSTGLDLKKKLNVADIGCGTGAQTLVLANKINGQITAIDIFPKFLQKLETRALENRLFDKIKTLACSMDNLPFNKHTFDLIWSEGAIYIMGFEKGIKEWRQFLKPGGVLAVSEISWITDERPREIQEYWKHAYTGIDGISNKLQILKDNGYNPLTHFVLPESCWIDNYYASIEKRLPDFKRKHPKDTDVDAFIINEQKEIQLYKTYKNYYGYVFYIAQKSYDYPE